MTRTAPRRGRPPLDWLTPAELAALPAGTAVAVETTGGHTSRLLGRVATLRGQDELVIHDRAGVTLQLPLHTVRRGRTVPELYGPGDPVLRRGTPASEWRGGVVRVEGTSVLVEQIGGEFVWMPEDDLEPAEGREAPPAPRGPVPARAG